MPLGQWLSVLSIGHKTEYTIPGCKDTQHLCPKLSQQHRSTGSWIRDLQGQAMGRIRMQAILAKQHMVLRWCLEARQEVPTTEWTLRTVGTNLGVSRKEVANREAAGIAGRTVDKAGVFW